jgi:hypothetical protein
VLAGDLWPARRQPTIRVWRAIGLAFFMPYAVVAY